MALGHWAKSYLSEGENRNGGGGGESPFKTAVLTIEVLEGANFPLVHGAFFDEQHSITDGERGVANSPTPIIVILGEAGGSVRFESGGDTVDPDEISGMIEKGFLGMYNVTGDCTVTFGTSK